MASSSSNKRKRDETQDDYSGGIEAEISGFMYGSKKSHTLDSDSEDENTEDYNKRKHSVLKDEDIEGQEDEAEDVDYDNSGVKITPFNMKDELEEGYFDGQGTYVWNKKDASEIKDNWLDSVDWMKLKTLTAKEKESRPPPPDTDSDSSLDYMQLADKSFTVPFYKQCLSYMKPGENILKAIKRHGGGNKTLSASERLKQKKLAKLQGKDAGSSSSSEVVSEESSNQEAVSHLTEIANKFISLGDMDIYQETFESLSHKVENFEKPPPNQNTKPEMATSDGLDMFSD